MSAPWLVTDTAAPALVTAVALGVAFGFALERAGLGSARKLASQFYGDDLTVLKVLFSAIVVAMLGAFWLGRLGVLDLARVAVPETWIVPQLAGGALFGAGMAMGGLCPGTSCVAAASGRGDGVAVLLGLFTGVLATGFAFAPLRGLYEATPRGPLTLPMWLGVPYGAVVLAVVVLALAAFAAAEWVERRGWERLAEGSGATPDEREPTPADERGAPLALERAASGRRSS